MTTQATQAQTSASAPTLPAPVRTPETWTKAATLAPTSLQPTSGTSYFDNPLTLVPFVVFLGIIVTVVFGWKKMKIELAASAEQSKLEREESRDQAKLDRQHDADQAHEERITKARREVYLELVSEMTNAQMALSLLPTKDVANLDTSTAFSGLIAATAKISVLGSMETVTASRELLTLIQETLMRVLVLLVPLDALKNDRTFHEEQRAIHSGACQRLIEELDDLAARNMLVKRQSEARHQMEYHHAEGETHGKAAIVAIKDFAVAQRAYTETVLSETKTILRKVDDLIFCMRTELNLVTSLPDLHLTSDVMQAAAIAASKRLYASLDAMDAKISGEQS